MIDLKSYFHDKYQGGENFIENVILPIFGEDKYEDAYEEDILENNPELIHMADTIGISQILRLGTIDIPMNPTDVFDITVCNHVQMERNRVTIQQLVRRIMSTYSSAFMVFHYDDDTRWDWRFTFCSKQGSNQDSTDSKRYTFLLGPNQSCRTAAENFKKLHDKIEKEGEFEIDDIIRAFDVEALSKEFFTKYKAHYERFCQFVYDHRHDPEFFGSFFATCEDKVIRDYVKKLLGRIVFLHFLQKKGWLGVPADKFWGEGDRQFMKSLFDKATDEQKENYLDKVLEPLFANALDINRKADNDLFDCGVEGFRNVKIPYLNGGLFERDKMDDPKSVFSRELFADLLDFLYQYNFTIDENDPNDAEVGVDPEMLGCIFENLLEDNKDKGAYYTPKEIVQYMCKESLIAYLTTASIESGNKNPRKKVECAIRELVTNPHEIVPRMNQKQKDLFGNALRKVRICDPAIGSGAFPMGLLNELVRCRTAIDAWATDNDGHLLEGDYAALKREIVCNNIYGVDIEQGAIDIARLRFWLSIVVDEKEPETLPNFDYKFMKGNSLITTFDGEFVNLDTKEQKHVNVIKMCQVKKALYDLKIKHYNAIGKEKHKLTIEIKDTILQLISLQLGYELRQWYETHSEQKLLFQEMEQPHHLTFAEIKQELPEDKQRICDLGAKLRAMLKDESRTLAERAQIDIRFFDWRMMFTEVFEGEKPGFDIVIGNPPWGADLSKNDKETFKKIYPNIDSSTPNSFAYFIGWGLSNYKCSLSFVLPDSILIKDFQKTRKLLSDNCKEVIWYQNTSVPRDKRMFRDVEHDICLILLGNKYESNIHYQTNEYIDAHYVANDKYYIKADVITESFEYMFNLKASNQDWNIFKKLTRFTSLDSIAQCHEGIHTGNVRDKLFINGYKPGLYPLFYGGKAGDTIQTYVSRRSNWYVNYDSKIIDKKKGEYASLRDERIFILPKIYVTRTGNPFKAFYDANTYASNNFFSLQLSDYKKNTEEELLKILPLINSKFCQYYIRTFAAPRLGNSFIETKIYHLLKLPIPAISQEQSQNMIALVKKIIGRKNNPNYDATADEREIDRLVYDLYGLTEEEIAIVEGTNS